MIIEKIEIPKFLHCENEPKSGDLIHDNRQFIYCTEYLSLIEIVPLNDYIIQYSKDQVQKTFTYTSDKYKTEEEFLFVYLQNNVNQINALKEVEFLQQNKKPVTEIELLNFAFDYYKNYLIDADK